MCLGQDPGSSWEGTGGSAWGGKSRPEKPRFPGGGKGQLRSPGDPGPGRWRKGWAHLRCSPANGLLLREDSQAEVGLLVGLKSAGNQDVLARGQPEAVGDFPQVDERLASGQGGVVPEEVLVQASVRARALQWEEASLGSAAGLLSGGAWTGQQSLAQS